MRGSGPYTLGQDAASDIVNLALVSSAIALIADY